MTNDWVEVHNCQWLHHAHFVKSVLESEGIEVMIPDEQTLAVQPFLANAIGGARVMVRAEDAQWASELLHSVDGLVSGAGSSSDSR